MSRFVFLLLSLLLSILPPSRSWAAGAAVIHPSFSSSPISWPSTVHPEAPPNPPSLCLHSFADVDQSFTSYNPLGSATPSVALLPYQPLAMYCPRNCSFSIPSNSLPPVYGSFPYHARSSICFASIHAGIISDRKGGGVFVSRFYRHDWSNSSTQSIFPFNSSHGTLSNGVKSQDVDSTWFSVPSNGSEWSYAVRGRGDYIIQRRIAPFPPRAGHVHAQLKVPWPNRTQPEGEAHYHFIIGGHNSTHYLNDGQTTTR
jgi:hypothetical protein